MSSDEMCSFEYGVGFRLSFQQDNEDHGGGGGAGRGVWRFVEMSVSGSGFGTKYADRMEVQCALLARSKNQTLTLAPGYQGIPENLLMNLAATFALLVIYSLVYRTASGYVRTALILRSERWSDLLYEQHYYQHHSRHQSPQKVEVHHHLSLKDRCRTNVSSFSSRRDCSRLASERNREVRPRGSTKRNTSFFSWMQAIWEIEDRHVLKKNGADAVQYLTFQRHIIVFAFIVCVCVLSIILPLNTLGIESHAGNRFARTTISNVSKDSKTLWVHIGLSFVFLPLGMIFMRRFSTRLHIDADEPRIGRSLMVAGVPREHCKAEAFRSHFSETHPQSTIQDLQFAYDTRKLMGLVSRRERATQARLWCENQINATRQRPTMRPYTGGRYCCFADFFGCRKVDALNYYRHEESSLVGRVNEERHRALENPVGFVFVTFDSEDMAMLVCKDHKLLWQYSTPGRARRLRSSRVKQLQPHRWQVMFAPPPSDLLWENLAIGTWAWYARSVCVNMLLFVVLFFLTTPFIILSSLSPILNPQLGFHPLLEKFLPTVMLWCVATIMPAMVTASDLFVAHWTRSSRNHSVMKKVFVFLLFMVLILPSLGLLSAESFVGRLMRTQNTTEVWKCLYLPDSGAFFVNYVITSSLVGSTMELIRIPQLFIYLFHLFMSRSKAEQNAVRRRSLLEFYFGVHYAWYLLMFAIIMVYSIPCPLVTPFGVLHLSFRHFVDKYNIYFVYNPSKTNKYIHATAIDFVTVSLILLQFAMFMYVYFKSNGSMFTVVMCVVFMMSFCLFVGQSTVKRFRDFGPIRYIRQLQKALERRRTPQSGLPIGDSCYNPDALKSSLVSSFNKPHTSANSRLLGSGNIEDALGSSSSNAVGTRRSRSTTDLLVLTRDATEDAEPFWPSFL